MYWRSYARKRINLSEDNSKYSSDILKSYQRHKLSFVYFCLHTVVCVCMDIRAHVEIFWICNHRIIESANKQKLGTALGAFLCYDQLYLCLYLRGATLVFISHTESKKECNLKWPYLLPKVRRPIFNTAYSTQQLLSTIRLICVEITQTYNTCKS